MVVMDLNKVEDKLKEDMPMLKQYQITITEEVLLRGICNLVKSYQTTLDMDATLFEDEKYELQCVVDDLRELLEEVEGLY